MCPPAHPFFTFGDAKQCVLACKITFDLQRPDGFAQMDDVHLLKVNIGLAKIPVLLRKVNIAPNRGGIVLRKADVSVRKVDLVLRKIDILLQKTDVVLQKVDVLVQKVDVVLRKVNVLVQKSDVVPRKIDVLVQEANVDPCNTKFALNRCADLCGDGPLEGDAGYGTPVAVTLKKVYSRFRPRKKRDQV